MEVRGSTGGVLVFCDNRVLELINMKVGVSSISSWFKNYEDGFVWMFIRV